MKVLVRAERYESCGALARLAIPIYEKSANHKVGAIEERANDDQSLGSYVNLL